MAEKEGGARRKCSCSVHTRDIRCPFFRRHSRIEIRCEAMMDRCSSALVFERETDKAFYQATYCEMAYDKCEHYLMLMQRKYSDD